MKLYAITVAEKCENDNGKVKLGRTRTVAIYTSFEEANVDVSNNTLDMWEMLYDYAFIEEIESDEVYPLGMKRWMYKFNWEWEEYRHIEMPDFIKKCYSISGIG